MCPMRKYAASSPYNKYTVMGIFKRLFGSKKKKVAPRPRVPTWDEVVESLYGKDLSYADEVVEVIYSTDRSRRYVVLRSDIGYYTYISEQVRAFDEDELNYFPDSGELGYWLPEYDGSKHIFDTYEHAKAELRQEPDYKRFFVEDDQSAAD